MQLSNWVEAHSDVTASLLDRREFFDSLKEDSSATSSDRTCGLDVIDPGDSGLRVAVGVVAIVDLLEDLAPIHRRL
jgi:hypothetical protein